MFSAKWDSEKRAYTPRGTRANGEISEARFILSSNFEHSDSNLFRFAKFEITPFEIKIRTYAFELITVP